MTLLSILTPGRISTKKVKPKTRPVCLVLRMRDPREEIHHLMLVAITSREPTEDRVAIEVPDTERQRAKLTRYPRAWIIVDEYNYDIEESSWSSNRSTNQSEHSVRHFSSR